MTKAVCYWSYTFRVLQSTDSSPLNETFLIFFIRSPWGPMILIWQAISSSPSPPSWQWRIFQSKQNFLHTSRSFAQHSLRFSLKLRCFFLFKDCLVTKKQLCLNNLIISGFSWLRCKVKVFDSQTNHKSPKVFYFLKVFFLLLLLQFYFRRNPEGHPAFSKLTKKDWEMY